MKTIDIASWKRRDHYTHFSSFDYPHFNLTAPVNISNLPSFTKETGISIYQTIIYLLLRCANEIEEFRTRIHDDSVVLYDTVHAGPTVMGSDDLFGFCFIEYQEHFGSFIHVADTQIRAAAMNVSLDGDPRDDVVYMSAIPWVSFTGILHPVHISPADSIPRVSWGKIYHEGDTRMMPLSVQLSHALADGIHVGRYFQALEEYCRRPDEYLVMD